MNQLAEILPAALDNPQIAAAIQAADDMPAREDRWAAYASIALQDGDQHLISFVFGKIAAEFGNDAMARAIGCEPHDLHAVLMGAPLDAAIAANLLKAAGLRIAVERG